MSDAVLGSLRGIAKAIYSGGRFVDVAGDAAVFALNNAATRDRAEKVRGEVEAALEAHFGRPIKVRLIDEAAAAKLDSAVGSTAASTARPNTRPSGGPSNESSGAAAESGPADEEIIDVSDLQNADGVVTSGLDKLVEAFPGAVVMEQEKQ